MTKKNEKVADTLLHTTHNVTSLKFSASELLYSKVAAELSVRFNVGALSQMKNILGYRCGRGEHISKLPNAIGYETNAEAVTYCEYNKIRVTSSLTDLQLSSFDVVICAYYIEKTNNVQEELRTIKSLLSPKGKIVLVMRDKDITSSALQPFSIKHLKEILEKIGLEVVAARTQNILLNSFMLKIYKDFEMGTFLKAHQFFSKFFGEKEYVFELIHA
jgi:SAM-dependent methyltransferase